MLMQYKRIDREETRDSRAVFDGVATTSSIGLGRQSIAAFENHVNRWIRRWPYPECVPHLGKWIDKEVREFHLWEIWKEKIILRKFPWHKMWRKYLPSKSKECVWGLEWILGERTASAADWLNSKRFTITCASCVASAEPVTKRVPHRLPVSVAITGRKPCSGRWPALAPRLAGREGSE